MVIENAKQTVVMVKLGEMLRAAREKRELSLKDIAAQTRISEKHLAALEAEDFEHLPNMTFVRGFVRNYAKLLQLDANLLLSALPSNVASIEAKPVPESIETPFASRFALRRRQNIIWLTATACVILAAVGFLVWSFNTPTESTAMRKMATVDDPLLPAVSSVDPMVVAQGSVIPQAVTLAASPVHAAASSIVAAPVVSGVEPAPVLQNPMLRLVFDEESWTEIREQSGKTLSSQLNSEGTELRLDGRPPFSLVIGNATSVHLFYKGVEVNLEDHLPHADSSIARLKLE